MLLDEPRHKLLVVAVRRTLLVVAAGLTGDRLLVETDAPFLAPTPHRGKPNEPAFVAHTAAFWAERKGVSAADFHAQTGANFFRLFKRVPQSVPVAA